MNSLLLVPLLALPLQEKADFPEPLLRKIDLDLRETPFAEAVDLLFRKAETALSLPEELPDRKLTLALKGVSAWEGLDALCRAHGGVRVGLREAYPSLVEAVPFVHPPVHTHGPLRFNVHDVARIRELRFPARFDRTDLAIALRWLPEAKLFLDFTETPGSIRLDRVDDEVGRSLLPVLEGERDNDFHGGGSEEGRRAVWLFRLAPAAPDAKLLARVEGVWTGASMADVAEIRFERPGRSTGERRQAGAFLATLLGITPRPGTRKRLNVRLRLEVDPAAPLEVREALRAVPLSQRVIGEAAGRDEGGGSDEAHLWAQGEPGPAAPSVDFEGFLDDLEEPLVSLTVRVLVSHRNLRIPFSFRDVPLPEEDR